jgi:hypothetical protein
MTQPQSLSLSEGLSQIRQQMGPFTPGQLSTGEKFWRDHYKYYHIHQILAPTTNSLTLTQVA